MWICAMGLILGGGNRCSGKAPVGRRASRMHWLYRRFLCCFVCWLVELRYLLDRVSHQTDKGRDDAWLQDQFGFAWTLAVLLPGGNLRIYTLVSNWWSEPWITSKDPRVHGVQEVNIKKNKKQVAEWSIMTAICVWPVILLGKSAQNMEPATYVDLYRCSTSPDSTQFLKIPVKKSQLLGTSRILGAKRVSNISI